MSTIDWIVANELPTGGIAAWPGGPAYPEVTGYLIPTLLRCGEKALAARCAEWLLSIQHDSGGFPAIDGHPRLHAFDTAAVVEGLRAIHQATGRETYRAGVERAQGFLSTMVLPDGRFRAWEGEGTRQYCVRINGIMNLDPGVFRLDWRDRSHFIAYALEGYLNLKYTQLVRAALEAFPVRSDGLVYYRSNEGTDIIATAQIAILKLRTGLDASAQVEAVRRHVQPNGGIPQAVEIPTQMSWGAKFYLDMEALI